jgi:exopolysaccharide biosynthesis polyprenyl glycosylphosphotransferase
MMDLVSWTELHTLVTPTAGGMILAGLVAASVGDRVLSRRASMTAEAAEGSAPRPIRAVVIGAGSVGRRLADALAEKGEYQIVGMIDDGLALDEECGYPILGRREETQEIVDAHNVDEVFIAYAPTWQQQLTEELSARTPDVRIHVVPSAFETMMSMSTLQSVGDIALVQLASAAKAPYDVAKRGFDIAVSGVGLLLVSPLMLLIAALIRATSRGPAIFTQERIGRDGERFTLLKFRTMVADAEADTGPVLSRNGDGRLTVLGRWLRKLHVDELPQLWNVLRGDMSIIGPRPERPYFVEEFEREIPAYRHRHRVRPGITGLAQVLGGYHTDARDKLRFDLYYVNNRSPWLDLVVLARTFAKLVARRAR